MAFVATLRFNDDSGAILGDEESWHLRRSKTYINDPVHNLLKSEDVKKHGVDLVYAGSGTTGFHKMVVEKSRVKINDFLKKNGKKTVSLSKIARLVLNAMNETHLFWRDNRLKLYFDFTIDDYNNGGFTVGDTEYKIENADVRKKAKKLIDTNEGGGYHNKNHALLMGYDKNGVNSFCLKSEFGVLSYVSCGFDVLGQGKYGSCAQFKDILENLTLKKRRTGFSSDYGIYTLVRGALGASEYYNEAGGNFHITIIDRKSKTSRIELKNEKSILIKEIVRSEMAGLITRENALTLIDELVFKNKKIEIVEKNFYKLTENPVLLDLYNRGYKLDSELKDYSELIDMKKSAKGGKK